MTHRMTPGQPLVVPAAAWNRMDEASGAWHAQRKLANQGQAIPRLPVPTDRVLVKNMAGEDLPAGAVVEIGDPAIDAEQLANDTLWFEADKPSTSEGIHAVLRQALPDGEIGEAQLAGAVMATVNVNDVEHTCCLAANDATELESSPVGPHRLLHAPDTGSQLCAVLLGGGITLAHGEAVDEIEQDATGTVTIGEIEFEAKNHTGITIAEESRVRVYVIGWDVFAEPLECPE